MGFTALDAKGRKIFYQNYDKEDVINKELYCPCCRKKVDYVISGRTDSYFAHSDEKIKDCQFAKLDGSEGKKLRQATSELIKKLYSKKEFTISIDDKIYTFPSEKKIEIEECIKWNDKERFCTAKLTFQDKNLYAVFEIIPEEADENFVKESLEFYKNKGLNAFLIRPSGLEGSFIKIRKEEHILNSFEKLVKKTDLYEGFATLSEIASNKSK
jgi:hypothetical protein